MASSNPNGLGPEDLAYYAQQARAVRNTQAIGQQEFSNAQSGADLSYQQKLQALSEQLTQQRNALPDKFAARGIQNSGIYGYGGTKQYTGGLGSGWTQYAGLRGSQTGAMQQFKNDAARSQDDIINQQENVDQGYGLKGADLNNTASNQLQAINVIDPAVSASQAASDAIGAA